MGKSSITLLGEDDLGGFGNGGEGMAMYVDKTGRRVLFIAHSFAPKDFSVVDVSDPRSPKLIYQCALPHDGVRSNNLALHGDVLAVTRQANKPGGSPGGVEFFDISNPEAPQSISFFDTSGGASMGVHFIWWSEDGYAYLSTGMPDFKTNHKWDRFFPVIIDARDPLNVEEVGRWWMPGTREGDAEYPIKRPGQVWAESLGLDYATLPPGPVEEFSVKIGDEVAWDFGYRSHNIHVDAARPDRAYVGYISGGVMVLDISDKSAPKLVGRLEYTPPFPGYTHTVVPLFSKELLAITDECVIDHALDYPKLLWFADMRFEPRPAMISTAPLPHPDEGYREKGGRYGAHNLHENLPGAHSWRSDDILFGSFFSGGVRAFDLTDPLRPELDAVWEAPDSGPGSSGTQINDVYVDENALIYALDRIRGGLFVLEYNAG
jgi:hypothetical protein